MKPSVLRRIMRIASSMFLKLFQFQRSSRCRRLIYIDIADVTGLAPAKEVNHE